MPFSTDSCDLYLSSVFHDKHRSDEWTQQRNLLPPPPPNYQDDLEERALEDFETAASLRKLLRQVADNFFNLYPSIFQKILGPHIQMRNCWISKSYKRLKGNLTRSMGREAEVEISEIGKIPHRPRASEVPCFSSQHLNWHTSLTLPYLTKCISID